MYDCLVIGGGITGTAVLRQLSRYKLKLALLEAKADVAMGATGANSAILHAGYDAKPGTLMARLNVRGNELYSQLADKLGIPVKRCGSFVLAIGEEQRAELHKLYDRGIANGVPGMELLSGEEARRREPALSEKVVEVLYASTAGITCPWGAAIAFAENAADNGAEVIFNAPVTAVDTIEGGYRVTTPVGVYEAAVVINAAGTHSAQISKLAGAEEYPMVTRKGEYRLYDKNVSSLVNTTIFQLPSKYGKGILVSPTVHGNMIVGPTAHDCDDPDDVTTTAEGVNEVFNTALLSVPSVPRSGVIRTFAGMRAVSGSDFIIKESELKPGFINCVGICSPGLSSAPAVAEYICTEILPAALEHQGRSLVPKSPEAIIEVRKPIPSFAEASPEERRALIAQNPAYGRIICRCETVTEAEIVAALHRSVPALTVDAVKRRTRAGMGRCQGGFCGPRVMELMSRELGIPQTQITRKGGESYMVVGELKGRKSE